ncbi:hypothetical protein [Absidia glauca]|uniref:Uncharacterized protein n=1 Tax=Absidia glauca TaxID=4829 RepID=A0A168LQW0_ABSGL|nr:hypothetical protein [Absidia glauca]
MRRKSRQAPKELDFMIVHPCPFCLMQESFSCANSVRRHIINRHQLTLPARSGGWPGLERVNTCPYNEENHARHPNVPLKYQCPSCPRLELIDSFLGGWGRGEGVYSTKPNLPSVNIEIKDEGRAENEYDQLAHDQPSNEEQPAEEESTYELPDFAEEEPTYEPQPAYHTQNDQRTHNQPIVDDQTPHEGSGEEDSIDRIRTMPKYEHVAPLPVTTLSIQNPFFILGISILLILGLLLIINIILILEFRSLIRSHPLLRDSL